MATITYDAEGNVLAVATEYATYLLPDGTQVTGERLYAMGEEPPMRTESSRGEVKGSKQWLGPLPFDPVKVRLTGPPGNKRISRIYGPNGEVAVMPKVLKKVTP
jgi:hypothetical protein